jgi:hypothetical protein
LEIFILLLLSDNRLDFTCIHGLCVIELIFIRLQLLGATLTQIKLVSSTELDEDDVAQIREAEEACDILDHPACDHRVFLLDHKLKVLVDMEQLGVEDTNGNGVDDKQHQIEHECLSFQVQLKALGSDSIMHDAESHS